MIYTGGSLSGRGREGLLPAVVLGRAQQRSDQPALIDGLTGRTLTYGELAGASRALAGGLYARGYHPGESLALGLDGQPECAAVLYGALAAGLRVVIVDPLAPSEELHGQLRDSRAQLMVTAPQPERLSAHRTEQARPGLVALGEAEEPLP